MLALVAAASVLAGAAVKATGQEAASYALGDAPARLAPGIQAAEAALAALQRRLAGRLLEELAAGGPARAITVCRDEAPALTAQTAREKGVRVGRASHRLRNPRNAAPAWAQPYVAAGAQRKAAALEPRVVDLGDRVGVLRPIGTAGVCLQCHGAASRLSPDVQAYLAKAYPDDRAVGFEEGDLRGFAWAEAPIERLAAPSARP